MRPLSRRRRSGHSVQRRQCPSPTPALSLGRPGGALRPAAAPHSGRRQLTKRLPPGCGRSTRGWCGDSARGRAPLPRRPLPGMHGSCEPLAKHSSLNCGASPYFVPFLMLFPWGHSSSLEELSLLSLRKQRPCPVSEGTSGQPTDAWDVAQREEADHRHRVKRAGTAVLCPV